MAKRERVVRMSVEQPLWRALTAYRLLTMVYAALLFAAAHKEFPRPGVAIGYLAFLAVWTLATSRKVANAASCTKAFLVADLTVAIVGIVLTPVADTQARIHGGGSTLPTIWTAGAVLAFAIKGGWRWACFASTFVAAANLAIHTGQPTQDTLHNVLLVWVASVAIGYVVEVARASENTLARALEIEAATRERERLARDIHDGVLQVLAMVQRRGSELGGEAEELGRMAGEQEVALRTLVSSGLVQPSRVSHDESRGALVDTYEVDEPGAEDGELDLRTLLAPHAGSRVSFAEPGTPVPLPVPAGEGTGRGGRRRPGQRAQARRGRGAGLDPRRGLGRRGDRDRSRRRPRHPGGPASTRRRARAAWGWPCPSAAGCAISAAAPIWCPSPGRAPKWN